MLPRKCVDLTLLKPDARIEDFKALCRDALKYQETVRAVCILPDPSVIKACVELLKKDSDIFICCVNDFPFGRGGEAVKEMQADIASRNGADEVDTVINVAALREGDHKTIFKELESVTSIFDGYVKVILETGYKWYSESLIATATLLAKRAGAFCVKTSTGIIENIPAAEKVKHVQWMHRVASELKIKVAGGIGTVRDAELFLNIPDLPADKLIFGASKKFWLEE